MLTAADNKKQAGRKAGFYIGVTCPGCGGDLEIEDNFFVLTCDHCGSNLKIVLPDKPVAFMVESKVNLREIRFGIDRYLKENDLPLTNSDIQMKHLLYPYWKVDGVMLKVRTVTEKREIFDNTENSYYQGGGSIESERTRTDTTLLPSVITSPAGLEYTDIPPSLGLRTEYITIVPFTKNRVDDEFKPLHVTRTLETAKKQAMETIAKLTNYASDFRGPNKSELLNPKGSIVYFPYVIAETYSPSFYRFTIDGLTGRVLDFDDKPEVPVDAGDAEPISDFGDLTVELHRCHNCGFDLPAGRSYVYICDNCQEVNRYDPVRPVECAVETADGSNDSEDPLFPFWLLELPEDEGEAIRRVFGGLFRSPYVAIPAFTIPSFEAVFRLAKRMSSAVTKIPCSPVESFNSRFLPVTLAHSEALMLGEVIVYRDQVRRNAKAQFDEVNLHPVGAKLVYVPFHAENYFYVDSILNAVTVEKSLVK